jgi:hypothetical protein
LDVAEQRGAVMYKSQIKLGIQAETLEFKFELKVFDDREKVKENSIFSKCLIKNTPQSLASNEHSMSTSTLLPVCS